MAFELTRLIAIWVDDPMQSVLTCDFILDPTTHKMSGMWDVFGAIDHASPESRPFILNRQGIIDFGSLAQEDMRYWRVPLRELALHIGLEFWIEWPHDDRGLYRIERLAKLGSKGTKHSHDG
jgi:hypothetical protein